MTATNEENVKLGNLLFPNLDDTPSAGDPGYFEAKYPPRDLPEGAYVTRLGPSPTGFIHLGNLYTAFMNEKLANQTDGIVFLRIEDTDSKREVEGAVEALISALKHFGVSFDEGVLYDEDKNEIKESGNYGPYYQSDRTEIYHTFIRQLVLQGKAYPCFFTEDEIAEIRTGQESVKRTPGIYGEYAKYRDIRYDEAKKRIDAGEKYVIRFKEVGSTEADAADDVPAEIVDGIRGKITVPRNQLDVVLLKSDGVPTYHFAHAVDDHLMRTTHVIRGEEWISSLPIHVSLFHALGFKLPTYCHSTVLMKMDGEKKRKLSKRKDPELSLDYYRREGYHPKAILEYLLTIMNSNFEEWRTANPGAQIEDFWMTTEKMGVSGILFDLEKLEAVSKDVLLHIPAEALSDFLIHWANMYKPEAHSILAADKQRLTKILDIGRMGDKPRKDLAYAAQIFDFISYFYDPFFAIKDPYPENTAGDVPALLSGYLQTYDHCDDRDVWFHKIRTLAEANGYAAKPKDFKQEPEKYKGHVGDVSAAIRIAIVGRASSPDLYEIQQIIGEAKVRERLEVAAR
ncbi:MAG: glutamate--tRNA ligase [Clostridiales Family XIII bacterium]|jgi:glutamyl-tRNA synthetase|nr:glutamate--tRNA ligase [Clostridiales Family XIII bacterium]